MENKIVTKYIAVDAMQYEALQAKCDRYEAALKEIRGDGQKFIPAKHDILLIVNEALSGEGEKPAKEIEYMPVHPEDVKKPG